MRACKYDVLREVWKSVAVPSTVFPSNFATETNLHIRKPRYSKIVIQINFLMDNDNI